MTLFQTSLKKEHTALQEKYAALEKELERVKSSSQSQMATLKAENERLRIPPEEKFLALQKCLGRLVEVAEAIARIVPKKGVSTDVGTLHLKAILLDELIVAIKQGHTSILSTPNLWVWLEKKENTFPLLDFSNLAGNAPIIHYLMWLKELGATTLFPEGATSVTLVNLQITKDIFEQVGK